MRGLAHNFASTHQTENPQGFLEVGENKQLLTGIVRHSFIISVIITSIFSLSFFIFFKPF
ncbi:hypothetical protein DUZ96_01050 [Winogradskyella sp. KYW1333]|nr:hypothetical protein DUZ96_01050 [Winogradskyella sp. KYW1333]